MSTKDKIVAYLKEEKYSFEDIANMVKVEVEQVLKIAKKMWKIRAEGERIYLKSKMVNKFKSEIFVKVKEKHNIILKEIRS